MKKRLKAMALALVLAVGGLIGAHCTLMHSGGAVEWTEVTAWGTPAAAEGLKLALHSRASRDRLSWDAELKPGEEARTRHDFRRFPPKNRGEDWHMVNFYPRFNGGIAGYRGGVGPIEPWGSLHCVREPVQAVIGRTQPGQSHTEHIRLAEYTDRVRLMGNLIMPEHSVSWEELEFLDREQRSEAEMRQGEFLRQLLELFQFPTPEDLWLDITIEKNWEGEAERINYQEEDNKNSISVGSRATGNREFCYFVLTVRRSDNGELLDYSLTPGYGVYRMPTIGKEDTPSIDELKLIHPLSDGEQPLDMLMIGDDVLLQTACEGQEQLHLLDGETGETIQTIPLGAAEENMPAQVSAYEDFLVCEKGDTALFTREPEGGLRYFYTAPAPEENQLVRLPETTCFRYRTPVYAFDGERLAVASTFSKETREYDWEEQCGVDLLVYDRTGLLFSAKYLSSLDRDSGGWDKGARCIPISDPPGPIELTWTESEEGEG